MNYRKSNLEDVVKLAELRKKQLIDEGGYSGENIDAELEQFFSIGIKSGELVVWVAIENENIVSTAGVCFFRYPPSFRNPSGKIAYITNVYTKDEYRKKGIASRLLELVMEEAVQQGCQFARLHASAQGRRMYEKIGFVDAEGFMSKRLL